ncbi:MAG: MerR family transcriptional regulator [Microcystaceae cyanobacterium]
MDRLSSLAQEENLWYLEEFSEIANQLLPEYISTGKAEQKEINPRLVRYYTTQGLLDDPERQGKYAVYTFRHLLQLLVVRRLMSEGIGISAIRPMISQKNNQELKNLLIIGVQLQANPTNPALAYLENLTNPTPTRRSVRKSVKAQASTWFHLDVDSGLKILVRSDFQYPANSHQQQVLQEKILQTIEDFIAQQRRGKP